MQAVNSENMLTPKLNFHISGYYIIYYIIYNSLNEGHARHTATLTGNVQAGFSADDSAKGVGRQALVDADVFVFVQTAYVKVSPHERVA